MHANHSKLLDHEASKVCVVNDKIMRFRVPTWFWIKMRAISSGIDRLGYKIGNKSLRLGVQFGSLIG